MSMSQNRGTKSPIFEGVVLSFPFKAAPPTFFRRSSEGSTFGDRGPRRFGFPPAGACCAAGAAPARPCAGSTARGSAEEVGGGEVWGFFLAHFAEGC